MSSKIPYVSTAFTVGVLIFLHYYYKQRKKPKIPEKWTKVGSLKSIFVYPVKSCAPIVLNTARCSILGLQDGWLRDRYLMVIDENHNFITARDNPALLRIKPYVINSVLSLDYEAETIRVDLAEVVKGKTKTAYVWRVPVEVLDCGDEVSRWISKVLNENKAVLLYKLVLYAAETCRAVTTEFNAPRAYKISKGDTGALPDEVSYNLINEASVNDLNARLKTHVSHVNYRPNFVLDGAIAFAEDNWTFIKIGDNIFEIVKPCIRCVLTTIDPVTGTRNPESLEVLKSYRQIEDPVKRRKAGCYPRFGVQMALRSGPGGIVSVNDLVYAA